MKQSTPRAGVFDADSARGRAPVVSLRRRKRDRGPASAASPETRAGTPSPRRRTARRVRVDVYRLAIVIALIYFVVTAVNQELVLTRLNHQLGALESELETVRAQQAVLRERLHYLRSDSYIVQEARGRFGMAHPGEIRYVIIEDRTDDPVAPEDP